jgi:putative transposase
MGKKQEEDRQRAIRRHLIGESPASIYGSLGYSERWFFKWLQRYHAGGDDWFQENSRRPLTAPQRTPREIEEIVKMLRLNLYNRALFCGAQAIYWELDNLLVRPLPSLSTINRILSRNELTHQRTGRYEPKGRKYPKLVGHKPGDVHQTDFVGPCYLAGPVRFYSLHSVDLASHRCAVEPLLIRSGAETIKALWASWARLGMPKHQQVDNEAVFYGSVAHPRGMGNLIRLCLLYGIEAWFIPPAEPWRNGVVEKFNDHWRQKFLERTVMDSEAALRRESLAYEARHNGQYRYSALGGKTPLATLAASAVSLRFPPTVAAPTHPLPKPKRGRYHLVRFIRSERVLDVFGERFLAPAEATYEYVRATVDVARQRLGVYLDGVLIDEHPYRLR